MKLKESIRQILDAGGGIAKAADFAHAGIAQNELQNLCESSALDRIRHGYYALPNDERLGDELFITRFIPEAIVSMESALFHYGYIDFVPRKWSITVPRTISRSKLNLEVPKLEVFYVQDELYALGKSSAEINDVLMPIYDRERCICDCFKHRSKLDAELFAKALKAYAKDPKIDLINLLAYAAELRVYKKVRETMEVLLNG